MLERFGNVWPERERCIIDAFPANKAPSDEMARHNRPTYG